jgi:pimeloyl-ACP methyl ester carboxylesterase
MIWDRFDRGTRRALLSLYRDADPERLAAAGAGLARLDCPALVLWGARDPYVGSEWGRRFADALPNARLEVLEGAGHWPWIDDPTVIDRVLDFVGESAAGEALAGR